MSNEKVTLQEVRDLVDGAEKKIQEILCEFSDETGLPVETIGIRARHDAVMLDQQYRAFWGRPLFPEKPMACKRQQADHGLKECIDCGFSRWENLMVKLETPNGTDGIYVCKECHAVEHTDESRCGDCGHWEPDADLMYPGIRATGELFREDEEPMCEACIQKWFDGQGPD